MGKSSGVKVNPRLLQWARESLGVETEDVAKRLGVKESLVKEWEGGDKLISYRRLETLATFFHRPLAAFFLPTVPLEPPSPTDFRIPVRRAVVISKALKLAVRRARFLRNVFSKVKPDHKKFERKEIKISDNPEVIASKEREGLGISFDAQRSWPVGPGALSNWIKILEENGVLVFQKGFPETELNGFSITENNTAPIIVLNSRDVAPRKIFTLFHEYCHLLLRAGGICKLKVTSNEFERDTSVESFCDRFAGDFLVPKDILFARPEIEQIRKRIDDERAIKRLADLFKVSRQVILLRLLLSRDIGRDYYDEKKRKFDAEFTEFLKIKRAREKKSKSGPPPYILSVSQNGKLYTRAVVKAFKEGRISTKEVSGYLGVKLHHLPNVESLL